MKLNTQNFKPTTDLGNGTKPTVAPVFLPPFRVGRKQMRAVLDARGYEVVVFPKGLESYAQEYADFLNSKAISAAQQTDVSRLLHFFDQMIKEENEALGRAGFYNQYARETHANNKYCLAIVKSLIERRFQQ